MNHHPPAANPPGLEETIRKARAAAARAGVEVSEGKSVLFSWIFDLENIEALDVSDVDYLLDALEELPGVAARVVYPANRAWVSAPPEVTQGDIEAVFASFGITAQPSPGTKQRLVQTAVASKTRVRRHRAATRITAEQERAFARAQAEGWLRKTPSREEAEAMYGPPNATQTTNRAGYLGATRDVLYTARGLITTPRLMLAVVLTVPVVLLSLVTGWQFPGWQWVSMALALPVVAWCAWPFHRALAGGVRRGATALDGASSIAVVAATAWSIGALVCTEAGRIGWRSEPGFFSIPLRATPGPDVYFDVACGITALLLIGRRWSMQSRTSLVDELADIAPDQHDEVVVAQRRRHPEWPENQPLALGEVNVGDDIVVSPGELIPVDGMVIGGSGTVAGSVLSTAARGTPTPVGSPRQRSHGAASSVTFPVSVTDHVGSGDQLLDGQLKVRVKRTGHATRIAAVERWVAQVNRRHNDAVMLSTRSASWLIAVSGALAVVSFLTWWLTSGNVTAAFSTALAVLACVAPPALALSSQLALRLGTETAARRGLLLREGAVLRRLENADTVIFNRVGTLTQPEIVVESVVALPGNDEDLLLRVAAGLVADSEHPVARAIVRAARAIPHDPADTAVPRRVEVRGAHITAGGDFQATCTLPIVDSEGSRRERHVPVRLWRPCTVAELSPQLARIAAAQGSPLIVNIGGEDRGVITLHGPVQKDAAETVDQLEGMGTETMMLSRDIYPVARRFADSIGISRILAGITPGRKAGTVRGIHAQGKTVVMVGDSSIAEALRVADVGVLVAKTAPLEPDRERGEIDRGVDVVVLRKDVYAVAELIALARRVCRIIDHNILFAWGYNAVALILALTGLLHPLAATVAMLAASLVIEAASNRSARLPDPAA